MIQVGLINKLKITREVDFGYYLAEIEDEKDPSIKSTSTEFDPLEFSDEPFDVGNKIEVLLPQASITTELLGTLKVGQELDVFIYMDSEDRPVATTEKPMIQIGQFALLEVLTVERVGAFLDWGLSKDLFLPFAEQTGSLNIGEFIIVFLYLDNTGRLAASMKLQKNNPKHNNAYKIGQAVNLMIYDKTDMGYKAIVENQHIGILYQNQVFQELRYGQSIKGYIYKLREDGKIDLNLQITGHKAADQIAPKILRMLESDANGFLQVNEKTTPETIYERFGVSKKKFKIALGDLYKKRLITIEEDGIRLVKRST